MVRGSTITVAGCVASVLASCALSVVGAGDRSGEAADSGADVAEAATDVTIEGDASPAAERVTEDLVVLYTFAREPGETVVRDLSGVEPRLDLVFADGGLDDGGIVWRSGVVDLRGPGRLSSTIAATKVVDRAVISNELTVEAWVVPLGTEGMGPARIVTVSQNPNLRNFTLGMEDTGFVMRTRSTMTNHNGSLDGGQVGVANTVQLGKRTHVVFTRSADGARAMFIDGVEHELSPLFGDLSTWDREMPLHLANEGTDDRIWLGSIELVAVYARALTPDEVQRNFAAGP